ncbi:hypothetical protein pb186bvf_013212 [Paramecium bursaria]
MILTFVYQQFYIINFAHEFQTSLKSYDNPNIPSYQVIFNRAQIMNSQLEALSKHKITRKGSDIIIKDISNKVFEFSSQTLIQWNMKDQDFYFILNTLNVSFRQSEIVKIKELLGNTFIQSGILLFYKKIKIIAKGGQGKTILAENYLNQQLYAIKCVKNKKEALNEIRILQTLNNQRITQLIEVYISTKYTYLVFKYMERNLKQIKMDHIEIQLVLQQVLKGISYIHQCDIIHRDIKQENIMLDENNKVKIIDFGLSQRVDQSFERIQSLVGTPGKLGPEIFEQQQYTQKADIFSFGVMMYEMYTKQKLIEGSDVNETMMKNRFFQLKSYKLPDIFDQGNDLLTKLLEPNPKKRLSADEALLHPYFACLKQKAIRIQSFMPKFLNHINFRYTLASTEGQECLSIQ